MKPPPKQVGVGSGSPEEEQALDFRWEHGAWTGPLCIQSLQGRSDWKMRQSGPVAALL